MVYRAKITNIRAWVDCKYNTDVYNILRDDKDFYIEIKDKEDAELLENMNRVQEQWKKLMNQWNEKHKR